MKFTVINSTKDLIYDFDLQYLSLGSYRVEFSVIMVRGSTAEYVILSWAPIVAESEVSALIWPILTKRNLDTSFSKFRCGQAFKPRKDSINNFEGK